MTSHHDEDGTLVIKTITQNLLLQGQQHQARKMKILGVSWTHILFTNCDL